MVISHISTSSNRLNLMYYLEGDSPRIFLESCTVLFILLIAVPATLSVVQCNHSVIWN